MSNEKNYTAYDVLCAMLVVLILIGGIIMLYVISVMTIEKFVI